MIFYLQMLCGDTLSYDPVCPCGEAGRGYY
jgi:hypothetical protein